jgi:two-component system chemotaxis response regulator CheY
LKKGNGLMARALIVDDSKFMRKIIRDTLEEGGHVILAEADNGIDGIEEYRKLRPDFVTMDVTMTGKDGIQAVSDIQAIDPKARIIIISAMSENTLKLNDGNLHANAFITKPFDKKKLLETINTIL